MADVVTPAVRSRMMSGIKGRDTGPEVLLRHQLHGLGLRYILHHGLLPGRPDLVMPKWRTVIFVHGCFWHLHGCKYSKLPQTREDFWKKKLLANKERDQNIQRQLFDAGWRCAIVWECALRGRKSIELLPVTVARLAEWIRSANGNLLVIEGES